MADEPIMTLESKLSVLAEDLGKIVDWKWDGRFSTAVGEFAATEKDRVLGVLEKHLVSTWDSLTVKDAPDVVQEISKKLGGLMSGQLLLLSDSRQAACIFCAWWPWGSGAKISIRIAPFNTSLADEDATALTAQFREVFKI
ncbi:hypothetical protein IH601_05515 [Candidatus Bipolaricaulota bacterium]|nr:hypothetical protein [Candidatus Bipolaricaulota bacterium]TFH11720.1 MAG: hypothetical protein E4H08_00700 [Candidatus Atribacteria bacterium]